MIIMTGGRHEFEPTEIAAGRELDGGFGACGAATWNGWNATWNGWNGWNA